MDLLFTCIAEEFIMQHDVFPGNGFVEFEFDLVHFVAGLHMDEEVCVAEDGVDEEVGAVLDIVGATRRGFDEYVLGDPTFAFFEEHPAVDTFPQIKIRSQFVWFVIIDCECFRGQFFFHLLLVLHNTFIIGAMCNSFREDRLIQIELFLDILVLIGLFEIWHEIAFH
jgi:hypothetical protein